MTVVADLVARLRTDSTDFEAGMQRAEGAVHGLGVEVEDGGEKIGRLRDLAGITATVIGGTFAGAMVAGIDITKNYVGEIQSAQTSFTALMGGNSVAANEHIGVLENFAAKQGLATGSVLDASKTLNVLTQGHHDGAVEMKKFADEAAGLQTSVDGIAQSYGQAFDMLQRLQYSSGGSGGTLATRGLVNQGLITQDIANQLQAEMKRGASPDQLWQTLMQGADKYAGSADMAAKSNKGLIQTFHDLLDQKVGQAFMPIEMGIDHLIGAVNNLMQSKGAVTFFHELDQVMTGVGDKIGSFVHSIDGVASGLGSVHVTDLVNGIHSLGPELGIIIGLVAEFSTEFLGSLPIINRFAGPFKAFLDDGRGALLGFLLASKDTRDALINLGGAFVGAFKGVTQIGGDLNSVLSVIAPIASGLINGAAAVVRFVSSNKEILDLGVAIVAVYEALKLTSSVVGMLANIPTKLAAMRDSTTELVGSLNLKTQAQQKSIATDVENGDSTSMLTKDVDALTVALREATAAQVGFNEARAAQIGMPTAAVAEPTSLVMGPESNMPAGYTQAASGLLIPAGAGEASAPVSAGEQIQAKATLVDGFGEALAKHSTGIAMGGMLVGGGLATAGAMSGNQSLSTAGNIIGMGSTGAMIGSFIEPGIGTAVGAALGGVVGGLQSLLESHSSTPKIDTVTPATTAAFSSLDRMQPGSATDYLATKERADAARSHEADLTTQASTARSAMHDDLKAMSKALGFDVSGQDDSFFKAYATGKDWRGDRPNAQMAADYLKNEGALPDLTSAAKQFGGNSEYAKSLQAESDQHGLLSVAAGITGKSFDEVAAKAQKAGVALDGVAGTRTGNSSITNILNAVGYGSPDQGATIGGKVYTPGAFQEIATQLQTLGNQSDTHAPPSFTLNMRDLEAMASSKAGNQGIEIPYLEQQLHNPAVESVLGNGSGPMPTLETLNFQKQAIDLTMQQQAANNSLTQSQFALDMAQAQGMMTLEKYNFDQGVHVRAESEVIAAQQHHQDSLWNIQQSTEYLTGADKVYGDQLLQQATVVQQLQNKYDDLNLTYVATTNQLQVLTDKQKEYQDVASRPLRGTSAADIGIHNNQMQQDMISEQINNLELKGVFSSDPQITRLQYELKRLQAQGSQLSLAKDLGVGNEQFQVQQAQQKGKEVDFSSAMKASEAYAALNPKVLALTQNVDHQKVALDQANNAYTVANTQLQLMNTAVNNLSQSDHAAITDELALRQAVNGVGQAAFGQRQAMEQVKAEAISAAIAAENSIVTIVQAAATNVQQSVDSAGKSLQRFTDMVAKMSEIQKLYTHLSAGDQQAFAGDYSKLSGSIAANPDSPETNQLLNKFLNEVSGSEHRHAQSGGHFQFADGGLMMFADGGMAEQHSAFIAQPGTPIRVMNEPETGGEAYIPLGFGKRDKGMQTLAQVMDIFGVNKSAVEPHADGGLSMATDWGTGASSGSSGGGSLNASINVDPSAMQSQGASVMGAFFGGVSNVWSGSISPFFNGIQDQITGSIKSPDTWLTQPGQHMMDGYWKAIQNGTAPVNAFFKNGLGDMIKSGTDGATKTAGESWGGIDDAFATPTNRAIRGVLNPLVADVNEIARAVGMKDIAKPLDLVGSFEVGGTIPATGLAMVHEGEGVLPKAAMANLSPAQFEALKTGTMFTDIYKSVAAEAKQKGAGEGALGIADGLANRAAVDVMQYIQALSVAKTQSIQSGLSAAFTGTTAYNQPGTGSYPVADLPGHTSAEWAHDFITMMGGSPSANLVSLIQKWEHNESGGGGGLFNPLNSVLPMPGSSRFNSVGVQNYPTYPEGLTAAVDTFSQGQWHGVLAGIRDGNPGEVAAAVNAEYATWGGGPILGDGGIAKSTPGGFKATLAEAGRDELVLPLPPGLDYSKLGAGSGNGKTIFISEGAVQVSVTVQGNASPEAIEQIRHEVSTGVKDGLEELLVSLQAGS